MANLTYDEVMEAIGNYAHEARLDGGNHYTSPSDETRKELERVKKIIRQLVDNQET
jgi:hypothetical protein